MQASVLQDAAWRDPNFISVAIFTTENTRHDGADAEPKDHLAFTRRARIEFCTELQALHRSRGQGAQLWTWANPIFCGDRRRRRSVSGPLGGALP